MATTAPNSRKLNLTRDQLAQFLTDQQQIRQFEMLFAAVDAIGPDGVLEVNIAAGIAQTTAVQALSMISSLAQESAINAALAENKANQAMAMLGSLTASVEGLQMAPPAREFKRSRYGSFYDTTTQTATVINTATAITFNSTDLSNGVYIGSPTSRIIVDSEGIYNFDTSFQIDKTSGGTAVFDFWFRLNGADVANSASRITIQGNNAEIFSSLNYFFDLKAGDYVELMFSVTDLSVELKTFPAAAPHPGIPSIILTVNNNIEGVQ
jgi:hypothetical protein